MSTLLKAEFSELIKFLAGQLISCPLLKYGAGTVYLSCKVSGLILASSILIFQSQASSSPVIPTDQFFLQQLDNRNGLSNSAINHIFRDSENIIWVGTWDGLNMYIGGSFHVFNYSRENDYKNIGSNVIQNIIEDKRRNIWISTIQGISRYEKHSGKFYKYFYSRHKSSPVSEQEYEIAVNAAGTVFCLTQKYGLTFYDVAADTFRRSQLPEKVPAKRVSKVSKLVFDEYDQLWMLNNEGGLDILSGIANHQLKRLSTFRKKAPITSFFYINKRIFYTTSEKVLYEIDPKTRREKQIFQTENSISSMIFYKDHYLIGWSSKGYQVFDAGFKPSDFLSEEARQMQHIKITSWALGSEQILWYGTDGNGVIKVFPKTKFFRTVTSSDNGMPYNRSVRAFSEENGNLLVGTKGSGIIRIRNFRSDIQASSWDKQYLLSPAELDNNSVFALKKGFDDLIYIGTDGKGIGVYNIKTKKFLKWANIKGSEKYPEFGSVYAILQDKDRSLWLGTSGYGLIHLQLKRTETGDLSIAFLERYSYNNTATGPANDIIYGLAEGNGGYLWIACRYGGLSLLDKKTGKFKTFKAFTYTGSLSNNDVLSVYKDSKHRIWVGTSYGLNWIDEKDALLANPIFKKITTENGLPNNTIHAIEEDSAGNIWVSTNKGLAKLQPLKLEISRYQQIDGLQSNEFSDGAVWKDSAGYLYFGGTHGFNYFLPENIPMNMLRPNLLVSGIQLGGDLSNENSLLVLKSGSNSPLPYSLSRKNNYFELQLKAISFLNTEKCEYAYFLEGSDKIWRYSGTNGKISYSNIPPGNYILKVKWSNGEGVWTEEASALKLEVKQYFWLTYPAIVLYLMILVVSVYVFYMYRKNKLQMKYQLEMEHLLRQKDETQHQQQLNFFTNIAHEIQTPLTMIMGSVEHFLESKKNELAKNKENNYFLSIVHQHTVRLSYLVQQLMEFRKKEAGYLNRNDNYVDVSKMLVSLTELFEGNPKAKRTYIRNIQEGMAGFVDKDKFEKILFNLLSNAFKHSGEHDTVIFKAIFDPDENTLTVTVSNSGCKLNEDDLERLFDRFFVGNQLTRQKYSTGIGLAFTRELVSLLDATISVAMSEDWIHFTLHLRLETVPLDGKPEAVITSAPSIAFSSLVRQHDQPSAEEENKSSLIDEIHNQSGQSILVVEDKAELRYLLRNVLKDRYIVYEAGNGTEALSLLRKSIPDLIISDVMMPDMDGLELCKVVKNTPALAQIPFIILSAKGSAEHKTEGYELGADAYIPKPFHISYLLVRIKKLLDYQQKMQNLVKDQHITNQFMDADLAETDKKFLEKLLRVIEDNLNETELSAATIEAALCISKMQLYRRLKSLTGMTPAEFIKRIRLKHAADMLTVSQYTVSEIFYRTGFNNKSYFFREFKKIYQCAPNEYRQKKYSVNASPMQL